MKDLLLAGISHGVLDSFVFHQHPTTMGSFRDMIVYRKAFQLAMSVYALSKKLPTEERYALIDQMRRSSRSVCVNFAEGYRKRRYKAHVIAKLTDCDMENTETQVHLDFAVACGYVKQSDVDPLIALSEEVGAMLNSLIEHPERIMPKGTR